jgi:hypothetical protein
MENLPPAERITRAQLVEKIQHGWAEMEKTLQGLNEEELTRPGPERWSVKDHLAHLTSWARGIVALLHKQPRWEAMGFSRDEIQGLSEDEINARIYQRNQGRSLADVRADFQQTHQDLIAAILELEDADLYRTYRDYQPFEPGHDSGNPIIGLIAGNSFGHYEEHIPWIKTVLSGQ